MSNVLIGTVATLFALMGVVALAKPGAILAPFGIHLNGVDGRNEVRAVYGGFGIAMSVLLIVAIQSVRLRDGIVVAVAGPLAGMAAGRIVSGVLDGSFGGYPRIFFIVETVLAAILLLSIL